MFQYIKNSFIRNVKDIHNVLLFAFLLMTIYYHEAYFDYSTINTLINIDLIVKIILIFFIFFTAIINRLMHECSCQLLFSYFYILVINSYITINNFNSLLITIFFLFIVLYMKIISFIFNDTDSNNKKYINKNIFIEFIINQFQKDSADKYIVGLISMWANICYSLFFFFIRFTTTVQLNFILNWLIVFFLFRLMIFNLFLDRKLEQIAQNKIAIFETSEYQGFIKTNKLLINENFIFSIAFVYIIAFIYHYSLVYEYLYCILIAVPIILIISTFKKNQVNKNLIL